jgi:ribonuclease HI
VQGQVLDAFGRSLGELTNNQAEYRALLAGLQRSRDLGATDVEVRSDSELLVRQMLGIYRVKNPGLAPLFQEAKTHLEHFESAKFTYVPRTQNSQADGLANQALNEEERRRCRSIQPSSAARRGPG